MCVLSNFMVAFGQNV